MGKDSSVDKVKPITVLIKEPAKSNLFKLDTEIKKLQNDMTMILSGYLAALGHKDGKYSISPDFNMITFTKKGEEK